MSSPRPIAPCAAARHVACAARILITILLLLPSVLQAPGPASAQTPAALWSAPLNLSRSGSASQPVAFAAPDGALQAFWWDRFDGLTTAIRQGQDGQGQVGQGQPWSEPVSAQIYVTEVRPDKTIDRPLVAMPTLSTDGAGRVHAFWQDQPDPDTGLRPLLHSRLSLGATDWSTPDLVAPGNAMTATVALDAAALPDGVLVLAYIREVHTASAPSGLYVRRLSDQGPSGQGLSGPGAWSQATLVYPSLYLRLQDPDTLRLRLTAAPDGALHLVWADAALEQALYTRSNDRGATWSPPQPVGLPESLGSAQSPATGPRVALLPDGGTSLVYQATSAGACAFYQQRVAPAIESTPTAPITSTETITAPAPLTPSPTTLAEGGGESLTPSPSTLGEGRGEGPSLQRILEARACPTNDRFWLQDDRLFWIWGEGAGQLTLLAWDAARAQWSDPWALDLRLRQPNTERWLAWDQLRVLQAQDSLVVLGTDASTGDVWLTQAPLSAIDLAYAAPSPWSQPEPPAEWSAAATADAPGLALAADGAGTTHAVWTSAQAGSAATTLYYARWDGQRWSRAAEVARTSAAGELLRHPDLLADSQGLLHLAWSGGEAGQIYYSRAKAGEAAAAGWSAPQELPAPATLRGAALAADWPQLGVDAAGRLTVAYVVPINEGRGVYVVQSQDAGETWSPSAPAFDASAGDWVMVDHPALAVALDGALHLAWTRAGMPGADQPLGIYYASSSPGQDPADPQALRWGQPLRLAEAGFDWPQLAWVRGDLHLLCARQGEATIWHRWVDASSPSLPSSPSPSTLGEGRGEGHDYGLAAWKPAARVPGWQDMALPVALALAGDTLHLAGIDRGGAPHYAFWTRTAAPEAPRWSAAETFWLGPQVTGGLGAAASAAPLGGQLAVALGVHYWAPAPQPSDQAGSPGSSAAASQAGPRGSRPASPAARLLSALRAIPTIDPATRPTWVPTATPTATPQPTPTATPLPTPAPDLSGPPVANQSAMGALLLAGGLAAALVLVALAMRGLFARRN